MQSKTNLTKKDHELIKAAKATADRLYVQDVHEVAAALRTIDQTVFTGIHIEASVGFADVCGEVAAMCTAISQGYREFETIIAIWNDNGTHKLANPCGRCRELISDFSTDTWVIVGSLTQPYKV